jgi:hypothetical protein
MRLTYDDIKEQHLRNINLVGSTDADIIADFNYNLGQRYQLTLAKLNNYKTVKPYTFSTTQSQTTYPFPPGLVTIEGGFITIGSVNYPLRPIESRLNIELLNAIQIQASALPQFYFVEQDSFQIWPIPQSTYTGTIYYHFRDRNLSVADFTSGTITLTNGSAIITNSSALFTPAMVGRWFTVKDPTVVGQGYWYRITGYTDTTHVTMGTNNGYAVEWANADATTTEFVIGETPELPEELHSVLAWGTAADFYAGMRKDAGNATLYDNLFWTGNPSNTSRADGATNITGGLLGGINLYKDRDNIRLIKRRPHLNPLQTKVFATTLSS